MSQSLKDVQSTLKKSSNSNPVQANALPKDVADISLKNIESLKKLIKEDRKNIQSLSKTEIQKYLPERFEPGESGCAEVSICAFVLEELQKGNINQRTLAYLSYATFLLGKVIKIPSTNLSMDLMPALRQFIPIAHKMGACDKKACSKLNKCRYVKYFLTS